MKTEQKIQKPLKNKDGFFSNISRYKYAYIMILPALILVTVFSYIPLSGIVIAFKEFDFNGVFRDPNIIRAIIKSPWVGLDNFKTIFIQPDMTRAIMNTLIYGFVLVFCGFPFPILLALLFNELRNKTFKKVTQTISYMPYFLSWISVIGLFYSFFANEGTAASICTWIFGEGYQYSNPLLDTKYFLPIIFFSSQWKGVGWSSVIFLTAIAGIDPTLYEAAEVDGCKRLKQIWYVTLPCIKGTIIIVLVMSLGSLVNTSFDQIYGFQNVFTQEKTEAINTLIYRQGIQNGEYDLATAFGLAQGLVNLILLLTANGISKKLSGASIW